MEQVCGLSQLSVGGSTGGRGVHEGFAETPLAHQALACLRGPHRKEQSPGSYGPGQAGCSHPEYVLH